MSGERIEGRFEVLGELGAGGMGSVLRAWDHAAGREVALKLLLAEDRPQVRERFRREAELTARLRHEGVVRIHGAGEHAGRPYLVYELIEGAGTLADVWPGLDREARLDLVEQVARAVGAAHALGIVHRDLKPSNVLIDADGRARVADFGVALDRSADKLTLTGALVGSPSAMAPEQLASDREHIGPATDVWALSVMLFELLTGQLPFPSSNLIELTSQVAQGKISWPEDPIPPHLRDLIRRGLQQDPAARPPDGDAFAAELAAARAAPEHPRRSWPLVLAAALLLVVGGLLAAWALTREPASATAPPRTSTRSATAPTPNSERPTATPSPTREWEPVSFQVSGLRGITWWGELLLVAHAEGLSAFRVRDGARVHHWDGVFGGLIALPERRGLLIATPRGFSCLRRPEDGKPREVLPTGAPQRCVGGASGRVIAWKWRDRVLCAEVLPGPNLQLSWSRPLNTPEPDLDTRNLVVTRGRVLVALRDRVTAHSRASGRLLPAHPSGATSLAASGSRLALGKHLGTLELRQVHAWKLVRRLVASHGSSGPAAIAKVAHLGAVVSLCFSPRGDRLLSASRESRRGSMIAVWDTASGRRLGWSRTPPGEPFNRLEVRADGAYVLIAQHLPNQLRQAKVPSTILIRSLKELATHQGQRLEPR